LSSLPVSVAVVVVGNSGVRTHSQSKNPNDDDDDDDDDGDTDTDGVSFYHLVVSLVLSKINRDLSRYHYKVCVEENRGML